jgi:glutamyl-tRNA synthetase
MQSDESLASEFKLVLESKGIKRDNEFILQFCKLVKEKVQFTKEFWNEGVYVFEAPVSFDEKVMTKKWNPTNKELFTKVYQRFKNLDIWTAVVLHDDFTVAQTELGKIDMQMLRVIISGVAGGPQLFDLLALIGKDETLKRMDSFLQTH